uniref:Uncharacterized protein n=1 Tax=Timema shepardi TaxID=629360 RepID=A0A7R9ANX7_TIMSH|nr:unnamed protein product [Timema shepardi]
MAAAPSSTSPLKLAALGAHIGLGVTVRNTGCKTKVFHCLTSITATCTAQDHRCDAKHHGMTTFVQGAGSWESYTSSSIFTFRNSLKDFNLSLLTTRNEIEGRNQSIGHGLDYLRQPVREKSPCRAAQPDFQYPPIGLCHLLFQVTHWPSAGPYHGQCLQASATNSTAALQPLLLPNTYGFRVVIADKPFGTEECVTQTSPVSGFVKEVQHSHLGRDTCQLILEARQKLLCYNIALFQYRNYIFTPVNSTLYWMDIGIPLATD